MMPPVSLPLNGGTQSALAGVLTAIPQAIAAAAIIQRPFMRIGSSFDLRLSLALL
jgi:hypothetical protein